MKSSFFNSISKLLNTELMAFIKTDSPEKEKAGKKDVSEIFFKGAWKEDGDAKWAFFRAEESVETSITQEQKEESHNTYSSEPVEFREKREQLLKDLSKRKFFSKPLKETEKNYVSITELGRAMTGRYSDPAGGNVSEKKDKIQVFFAEDTKAFRELLKKVITTSGDMEISGWAKDGQEAIEKFKEMTLYPDIILMDIMMPQVDGIEAVIEILKINPSLKIIMLTTVDTKEAVLASFKAGAAGYLRKDGGLNLIRDAIRQAAKGEVPPIQEEIATHLMGEPDKAISESSEEISTPVKKTEKTDHELLNKKEIPKKRSTETKKLKNISLEEVNLKLKDYPEEKITQVKAEKKKTPKESEGKSEISEKKRKTKKILVRKVKKEDKKEKNFIDKLGKIIFKKVTSKFKNRDDYIEYIKKMEKPGVSRKLAERYLASVAKEDIPPEYNNDEIIDRLEYNLMMEFLKERLFIEGKFK